MYRLHGTTRNPYNVNHYPGGSSSGSAAAVAAGNAPVNPLSPDIKIHILLTVLNTFIMELVRGISLNIKTSHPW